MKAFYQTGTGGSSNAAARNPGHRQLPARQAFELVQGETHSMQEMRALVRLVVQFLVDQADKVEVSGVDGQQTALLEVRVAADDTRHVIGRHGRTVEALRTLLIAVAAKHRKRVKLDILEGEKGGDRA
jgi:predicted RNA-binding protein YlqC (UPF0109 family)